MKSRDEKLAELSFKLRQVAGILSRVKTDEQGRVMMPKNDLQILRMSGKMIKEKSPVKPNLN